MTLNELRDRPIRSELSIPAADRRKIAKGIAGEADAVFLDLEDSVPPNQKSAAREVVVDAIQTLDWGRLPKAVRVNAVSTSWCFRDLIAVAGSGVDKIVLPKVQSAGDITFADRLLNQVEREIGRADPIAIEAQIEDASGLAAIELIAGASSRITELTFGQGDFAAATGMPAVDIGVGDEWDQAVEGDRWLYPRQRIVFAARAAGLRALNGPYAAFRDGNGFRAYCRMSRSLGFAGVWCIHPDQIAIANELFAPTPAEISRARATIDALEAAWQCGSGVVSRDAVMIDEATIRIARSVLAAAEKYRSRKPDGDGA
jgi:citrate lyase beta subunit